MHFLIYESRSTVSIDKSQVEAISKQSYTYNGQKGITGLLIATKDNFIQYLEGEDESELDTLFSRISNDQRHSVTATFRGETTNRLFGEWSMGGWFMESDEISKLEGYTDLKKSLSDMTYLQELDSEYFLKLMHIMLQSWKERDQRN